MKTVENVIVTARIMPRGAELELELPTFLPLAELSEKLLETLKNISPAELAAVSGLELRLGGTALAPQETLASLGIWDGSILEAVAI